MIRVLAAGVSAGKGGVESILMNVLKFADRAEFEITVLATKGTAYEKEIHELGIRIVTATPFGKDRKKYRRDLDKIMSDTHFDYVWINNTSRVDLEIFEAAKQSGAKTIAHIHGERPEGPLTKRLIFKLIERITEKKFYSLLDLAFACSQRAGDVFFKKSYREKHQVHILKNAIDVKAYEFDEAARIHVRQLYHIGTQDKLLIFIGRITSIKNPEFLIELTQDLPENFKLMFIGSGSLEQKIKNMTQKRDLSQRVMFIGRTDDVKSYMSAADLLLLPSKREGLPVTVLEAQANGLSAILSDTITRECAISDQIKFVNINQKAEWISCILNSDPNGDRNSLNLKMRNMWCDNDQYIKQWEKILKEHYLADQPSE